MASQEKQDLQTKSSSQSQSEDIQSLFKETGDIWDEELTFFNSIPETHTAEPNQPLDQFTPNQTTQLDNHEATATPPPSLLTETSDDAPLEEGETLTGTVDTKEDLTRRRAMAAAASRVARAKKKRVIETLRDMNGKLVKERHKLRRIVGELHLEVLAQREMGKIDLELENTLLREELKEHKQFLAKFHRVADGAAVTKQEKHIATLKGAKAAIGQVLGLLYTSSVDPSWTRGHSRLHPELLIHYQRLPLGASSKTASRINLRVDSPPILASTTDLQNVQWQVWADSSLSSRLSRHFGLVQEKEIKEIKLDLEDLPRQPNMRINVYYYREQRQPSLSSSISKLDTIFLVASESDTLPYNGTPKSGDATGADTAGVGSGELPEKYRTIVMASVSTKHSTDIASSEPGIHQIKSALLEGTVLRDMGDGTVTATVLNSYPLSLSESANTGQFLSAMNSQGWIDDQGYFTEASEKAANDFVSIFAESLSAETVKAYPWKE